MKIFAGPPGTGKTYEAAREAVRVLVPGVAEADIPAEHSRLVNEGRIIWVTFHPSYSYEDFVEGFRPGRTESGAITYDIVPGPFLQACRLCKATISAADFKKGDTLAKARGSDKYEVTHVDAGGVILQSNDNRSTSVSDKKFYYVDFYTLKVLKEAGFTDKDLALGGGDPEKLKRRQELAEKVGLPTTLQINASPHAAVFRRIFSGTTSLVEQDIVLVIDEMNRADLSRVMGELITLIEFDKREGAPEERQVTLAYSRRRLSVPTRLSIIGTMNTADRSLASMDLALRRRFEFIAVAPNPNLAPTSYGGLNVQSFFRAMNQRLAYIGGGDNLIGHADYMESKLEDLRIREGFSSDDDGRLKSVAQTLQTKTIPFLVDLFRSDWNRVRAAVGPELFELVEPPDGIPEDLMNTEADALWQAATWWDPTGNWDGNEFLKALAKYRLATAPVGAV
ncbi:AAA family ATPase [Azospirillum sp. A29]|uniref:McrB family protein n=1 Tax=Azospirillum sp. A29 TaxID=3160606 RepID=UPI00366ABEA5